MRIILILTLTLMGSVITFAQNDRDQGITLYNKGDYAKASIVLKRAVKSEKSDSLAAYYLGLTYLKQDKTKDAAAAMEKSVQISPEIAKFRSALSFVYLLRNNKSAAREANEALRLDSKDADAYFVLASIAQREEQYESALKMAGRAIEINPKLAGAYLVRAYSYVGIAIPFSGRSATPVVSRRAKLFDAAEDIKKFLELAPNHPDSGYYRDALDAFRFFGEYYKRKEENPDPAPGTPRPNYAAVKIIQQRPAPYTDQARKAGVQGGVILLIGLGADGKVGPVLVLKSLGYGLDQEAIKAAKSIKFEPALDNGKPVSTVITREYSFSIG